MTPRLPLSLACFSAAGAWPFAYALLRDAFMSPLDRALRDSFCGNLESSQFEMLGHCAACWTGAAGFIALGLTIMLAARRHPAPVRK